MRAPACFSPVLILALLVALGGFMPPLSVRAAGVIFYVNATVVGGANDGSSWANAFSSLQAALEVAEADDEIWLAAGIYRPTALSDPSDPRTATFQLSEQVAIYGGFAGSETSRAERDWRTNQVILSGDIGLPNDSGDNSYHVVMGANAATLDGVTITAGNADGDGPRSSGGGMRNISSSPTLRYVRFSDNYAVDEGGAIYNENSSPQLRHVDFHANQARYGGAMGNFFSSPQLTYVRFSDNRAIDGPGGAIYSRLGSSQLSNVSFTGNSASGDSGDGGAMFNGRSNPTLHNVVFSGNHAGGLGGAIYNTLNSPLLTNVTLSGNRGVNGGAIYNAYSIATIVNSIVWGNATESGTVIAHGDNAITNISYSLIEGALRDGVWDAALGTDGGNNLDTDPRFVEAVAGLDAPTSSGDLRLMHASPAINAGSNAALPEDTSDLDGDGNTSERLPLDLAGNPRVIDSTVDLGAYEGVPHVLAISRTDANPSNGASISFNVQFSMAVSGVTAEAFALEATGGQAGATISAVSGSGADWSVRVATVADAVGTIGLNLVDDDTLLSNDDPPAPLGGHGAGNGDFTGEVYTLDRAAPTTTLTSGPSGTTSNSTASFTFTGDDGNGVGVVGFTCALDAADFTPCSSPLELSNLSVGAHSLRVRAVDALGNVGIAASRNWNVSDSASAPELQMVFIPLVQR